MATFTQTGDTVIQAIGQGNEPAELEVNVATGGGTVLYLYNYSPWPVHAYTVPGKLTSGAVIPPYDTLVMAASALIYLYCGKGDAEIYITPGTEA